MAKLDSIETDKLSCEIFTILEGRFLFGAGGSSSLPLTPVNDPSSPSSAAGKVRILSVDGGGDGILAGAALSRLESTLRALSGDQNASIADFFDVAAGSGAGGVLASMLCTRGPDGRPLFSAAGALDLLSRNPTFLSRRRFFGTSSRSTFKRVFRDRTIRDFVKPVLVACYDLATGSPFVFSRADAAEAGGYDFRVGDVCWAAARADRAAVVRSVDGKTEVVAVGGGVGVGNPTAAAITHVLHNKTEFPFADGVEDLLVVSLGDGDGGGDGVATPSRKEALKIAGNCAADTVDQAVGLAFGHKNCASNYLRIQANEFFTAGRTSTAAGKISSAKKKRSSKLAAAEAVLSQRHLESVLFGGKRVSELSNAEKLDGFAEELIEEERRRESEPVPTVLIKQAATPRSSSATVSTAPSTSSSSLTSSSTTTWP